VISLEQARREALITCISAGERQQARGISDAFCKKEKNNGIIKVGKDL